MKQPAHIGSCIPKTHPKHMGWHQCKQIIFHWSNHESSTEFKVDDFKLILSLRKLERWVYHLLEHFQSRFQMWTFHFALNAGHDFQVRYAFGSDHQVRRESRAESLAWSSSLRVRVSPSWALTQAGRLSLGPEYWLPVPRWAVTAPRSDSDSAAQAEHSGHWTAGRAAPAAQSGRGPCQPAVPVLRVTGWQARRMRPGPARAGTRHPYGPAAWHRAQAIPLPFTVSCFMRHIAWWSRSFQGVISTARPRRACGTGQHTTCSEISKKW